LTSNGYFYNILANQLLALSWVGRIRMKQKSFKELFKEGKERGTYWAASIILEM